MMERDFRNWDWDLIRSTLQVILVSIGSLSNDDGNGNENGQKAIGLDSALASRFLYISLPTMHDYNVKVPNFTFY